MMKKHLVQSIWLLLVLLAVPGCSRPPAVSTLAGGVESHKLLTEFRTSYSQFPVLKTGAADVNGDGREDLVVIYQVGPETNRMRVVLDRPAGTAYTNEMPAPVANQVITFRDIDNKPPLEFVVQGSKGQSVGLAVYRVHDDIVENLFGEGMADCCN